MYTGIIRHYTTIQSMFTALNILCASSVHPSLPSNPWQHLPFYCLRSFAFSECLIVGITQCVAFSDGPLSLSHVHLRFLLVFSWLDGSFLS